MGFAILSGLLLFIVIFSIIWYIAELCSVFGIAFGCVSCSYSKKYVNTRGMGNFKSVKNYRAVATVLMIISSLVIVIWFAFFIWIEIMTRQYQDIDEETMKAVTEFLGSSISTLAVHIGSVIAGIIAQVQYKKAKELNMDILSGKVAPPPAPVVPMPVYPANPYQQNGYYGQPNNPYQQPPQNYNGQNPYGQQNGYNGQQYDPQRQSPYYPNPQGYQPPPQNNAYSGQDCSQPPQNGAVINGQTDTQAQSQFPDPTVTPVVDQLAESSVRAEGLQNDMGGFSLEKTVVCPNCGGENLQSSRFCTHCGQIMK